MNQRTYVCFNRTANINKHFVFVYVYRLNSKCDEGSLCAQHIYNS